MRPVTASFNRIVRDSHRMAVRARVCPPEQTGIDPDGEEIPIVDGQVTLDSTADIRSQLTLSTTPDLWPDTANSLLAPYGNELFVERGIYYGNGARELVSQGYFRIDSVKQDGLRETISLEGRDRMAGLIDARLETPYQFGQGTSFRGAFEFLVTRAYTEAQIEYDFDPDAIAFAKQYVAERDRHGFLADMVASQGKVWYWDYRGVLQVRDAPDPTTPVWGVTHGRDGVLVSLDRSLDREGVYNAVVATGESPGDLPPVRAIARDVGPASPTYYYGDFGKVPRFYASSFITTEAQAESAARSILSRAIGLPYNIGFSAVPNPALEPLDPVTVSYEDHRRPETHVLERLSLPLTPGGEQTAQTKEQTTTELEVQV